MLPEMLIVQVQRRGSYIFLFSYRVSDSPAVDSVPTGITMAVPSPAAAAAAAATTTAASNPGADAAHNFRRGDPGRGRNGYRRSHDATVSATVSASASAFCGKAGSRRSARTAVATTTTEL